MTLTYMLSPNHQSKPGVVAHRSTVPSEKGLVTAAQRGQAAAFEHIPGYSYGNTEVAGWTVSMRELEDLKISAGFTKEDERYLRVAGEVLEDQTKQIVDHWRSGIIANIPNLARLSRTPEGNEIPEYLAKSNRRFQEWILDTCFRPYDQDWINYQQEIASRHATVRENGVDGNRSTPYVPVCNVIALIAGISESMKPYLAAKGNSAEEVDKMHRAWCKSMQLQLALWAGPYTDASQETNEW
jgi:hypothetical protein